MTKYIIKEFQKSKEVQQTAGVKARDDVDKILLAEGFQVIEIGLKENLPLSPLNKLSSHFIKKKLWDSCLNKLKEGDILFIQFPIINHTLFLSQSIYEVQQRGVKIVLLIHDLETFRLSKRKDISLLKKKIIEFEELSILKQVDHIISHNMAMTDALTRLGISDKKIKSINIFDYLVPNFQRTVEEQAKSVIVAGNLRRHKAGYVYDLPNNCCFNLYGVGLDENSLSQNISYFGSFEPDDLPNELSSGFGLVWDGDSIETCNGIYGEYLKINNPHKTSLYLSANLPIICWQQAAIANFIEQNKCGILVNNLQELDKKLSSLSNEELSTLYRNAQLIGSKIRKGYYLKTVLSDIIKDKVV